MSSILKPTTWRSLATVGLSALLVWAGMDLCIQQVVPTQHPREVEDALADYQSTDPSILCLGSSHGRTFVDVGEELARRTGGTETIIAVPVEWGKLTSYEWVLNHRLRPLIEETDASGNLVRPNLRRFILVTEWWDTTVPEDGSPALNLPSRAWALPDFLADVRDHGLTSYNANYTSNRWRRLWSPSIFMTDRGHERIRAGLQELVRPTSPRVRERVFEQTANSWKAKIEAAGPSTLHPTEMAAFERILDYCDSRGLETTVILYPRMPATVSERAKRTTLAEFSRSMAKRCRNRNVRFVDMTFRHPMTDAEYADDFDHITAAGNRKFAEWSLDGPLRFLVREESDKAQLELAPPAESEL